MEKLTTIPRYLAILLVLLLAFIKPSYADFIGLYIGAGTWYHGTSGQINNLGTDADFEENLGLEKEFSGFSYIAVEHPFPLIPNARINQYSLQTSNTSTLTATNPFTFAGTNYTAGQIITTDLEWDEQDTLLYYEFLDNIVSFDAGLGAKNILAKLSVTSGGTTNTLSIKETLPIAYVMAGAHLPGTGLSFIVEQTVSFLGDMKISQNSSKIVYETSFMLGVELGHRISKANLDDLPNVTGEIEFAGPFVNLLFHF